MVDCMADKTVEIKAAVRADLMDDQLADQKDDVMVA